MSTKYTAATEVEILAFDLIGENHPHLLGIPILYVFAVPTPTSKGKFLFGRARKVSGLNAHLMATVADCDRFVPEELENGLFVIEISLYVWNRLSPRKQVALLDHELSHCWAEEDDKSGKQVLSLLPHDLEEFATIAGRHGLWSDDITTFMAAANDHGQLTLFDSESDTVAVG